MDSNHTQNHILPEAGVLRNATAAPMCPSGQYDGPPINSPEGGEPDVHVRRAAATTRKIMRCKHPLLLSTFNVRTLNVMDTVSNGNVEVFKTEELCYKLKQIGGEITGIQETRLKHEKDRKNMVNSYSASFGYTLYTVSAWENESNAATGGLGIVMGKTSHELLIGVERISDRIMKADFRGNPAMTIIVAYAPQKQLTTQPRTPTSTNYVPPWMLCLRTISLLFSQMETPDSGKKTYCSPTMRQPMTMGDVSSKSWKTTS